MSEQTPQRVWFITGCSTGLGKVLAETALRAGHQVVATARKPEQIANLASLYGDRALVLTLDVTSQASIDAAVEAAIARFGRIDVLVNNAGYGIAGAIEEVAEQEFMPMFDTNVFGLLRVTKAVLPQLRKQRSGHVLNLSSIGGLVGGAGIGYYNATKFAVNGLSEALAAELAPLGVRVTVIEPGPFRTDFLGRSGVRAALELDDYVETAGKMRAYFADNDGKQAGDPVKAAEAMIAVVESANPPRHLLLGKSAYARWTARLEQWNDELAGWKDTTLNADFRDDTASSSAKTEAR